VGGFAHIKTIPVTTDIHNSTPEKVFRAGETRARLRDIKESCPKRNRPKAVLCLAVVRTVKLHLTFLTAVAASPSGNIVAIHFDFDFFFDFELLAVLVLASDELVCVLHFLPLSRYVITIPPTTDIPLFGEVGVLGVVVFTAGLASPLAHNALVVALPEFHFDSRAIVQVTLFVGAVADSQVFPLSPLVVWCVTHFYPFLGI
jgi:hypothetical protein